MPAPPAVEPGSGQTRVRWTPPSRLHRALAFARRAPVRARTSALSPVAGTACTPAAVGSPALRTRGSCNSEGRRRHAARRSRAGPSQPRLRPRLRAAAQAGAAVSRAWQQAAPRAGSVGWVRPLARAAKPRRSLSGPVLWDVARWPQAPAIEAPRPASASVSVQPRWALRPGLTAQPRPPAPAAAAQAREAAWPAPAPKPAPIPSPAPARALPPPRAGTAAAAFAARATRPQPQATAVTAAGSTNLAPAPEAAAAGGRRDHWRWRWRWRWWWWRWWWRWRERRRRRWDVDRNIDSRYRHLLRRSRQHLRGLRVVHQRRQGSRGHTRRPRRQLGPAFQHVDQCATLCGRSAGRGASIQSMISQEGLRAAGQLPLGQRLHLVLHGARGRWRRRLAEQVEVHRRAQRVQVGPGALLHRRGLAVLLDRRIGRLEDRRQRLAPLADDTPRRAEVKQHRPVAGLDQDVVGRDVAVVDRFAVQQVHGRQQRHQQRASRGLVGRRGQRRAMLLQRAAAVQRHGDVGGAVGFPVAMHLQQRRRIEVRQHAPFVDEGAQPGLEVLGHRQRQRRDLDALAARASEAGMYSLIATSRSSAWSKAR